MPSSPQHSRQGTTTHPAPGWEEVFEHSKAWQSIENHSPCRNKTIQVLPCPLTSSLERASCGLPGGSTACTARRAVVPDARDQRGQKLQQAQEVPQTCSSTQCLVCEFHLELAPRWPKHLADFAFPGSAHRPASQVGEGAVCCRVCNGGR